MTDEQKQEPGEGQDTSEEIQKAVEERIQAEAQALIERKAGQKPNGNDNVDSKLIDQCIYQNELGDGRLYAEQHRNRLLFNNAAGEWLKWFGHTWGLDIMMEHLSAVEDVVDRLLDEVDEIAKQIDLAIKKGDDSTKKHLETKKGMIYKRISKYRTDMGRNAMVKFARTCREPLAIRGDELDLNPWLLGCPNGVVDLRTGKFRDGRPEEYITKASPVEWQGLDAKREAWETCLSDRRLAEVYVVVESELDGILLHQEAGDLVGVVAAGSSSTKPDDRATEVLRGAAHILVALDIDEAGAVGWTWWEEHFPEAGRFIELVGGEPTLMGDLIREMREGFNRILNEFATVREYHVLFEKIDESAAGEKHEP